MLSLIDRDSRCVQQHFWDAEWQSRSSKKHATARGGDALILQYIQMGPYAVVIRQVLLLGGPNCRAKIFEKNMNFCLQGGFQDIQMAFR
jgi:hypothetical protein